MKWYHYAGISLLMFLLLALLNGLRIYYDLREYLAHDYENSTKELQIIIQDMQKISNALYENIINKPDVITIFKEASDADASQQSRVRQRLYAHLEAPYRTFTRYGIQQLHFHLPDNRSFLRFHRPGKFGDDLTDIRDSVSYVNHYHKAISGFEEGKIFNGYRFVYPLFDEDGTYLGSVEVSSSLLAFKKMYQENSREHIDFILTEARVAEKVFDSERSNYRPYWNLPGFLIQTTLYEYDAEHCHHHRILEKSFRSLSESPAFISATSRIEPVSRVVFIDGMLYGISFIPMLNDFTKEPVGYAVTFHGSQYLEHFLRNNLIVLVVLFSFSAAFGLLLYYGRSVYRERRENDGIRSVNRELDAARRLLSSVIDSTDDIIFYKDDALHYIGCNRSFSELVGMPVDKIIGRSDADLFDAASAKLFREMDERMLERDEIRSNFEWVTFPDGRKAYMHTKKIPFDYGDSGRRGVLGISRDITDIHNMQLQLEAQSYVDELTHVENRKAYNERLHEQIALHHRYGTPFSMMLFDIDNFKSINDTYGHDTGDRVLVELAAMVRAGIRENDHLFRIGGEEFIVIFPQTSLEDAGIVAEKIHRQIAGSLDTVRSRKITISAGLVAMHDSDDAETLFKRVDTLMYHAKTDGKNHLLIETDPA